MTHPSPACRRSRNVLCATIVLAAHVLLSDTAITQETTALATVGSTPITAEMIRNETSGKTSSFQPGSVQQALVHAITTELLFAAARSEGYENDPEIRKGLKQAMVAKYRRDKLEPAFAGLTASDQEIEDYYRSHQARFGTPAMKHLAMIRIDVTPRMDAEKKEELRKRAETARKEALALEAGVPGFGSVAVNFSDDQGSRYRGGDIGWSTSTPEEWSTDIKNSVAALVSPGQISPVTAAADGLYIFKLMELRPAAVKPLHTIKDGIRYEVIREKRERLEQELLTRLKEKIPVTVNSALLQTVSQDDGVKQAGPPPLPKR